MSLGALRIEGKGSWICIWAWPAVNRALGSGYSSSATGPGPQVLPLTQGDSDVLRPLSAEAAFQTQADKPSFEHAARATLRGAARARPTVSGAFELVLAGHPLNTIVDLKNTVQKKRYVADTEVGNKSLAD